MYAYRVSNPDYSDIDAEIIDITPRLPQPKRKRSLIRGVIVAVLLVMVIAAFRGIYVYVDSLWYESLGFGSRL